MPSPSLPKPKAGVVIMTYGSATTAEQVGKYMRHIYGDKASHETIADFEERYRLVGHSPLIEITKHQAKLLEISLGSDYVVRAGMLHSEPFIDQAVRECHDSGAKTLVGIVLSPQFSSFIMEGYRKVFLDQANQYGFGPTHTHLIGPWPEQADFIELLAERTKAAIEQLTIRYGQPPAVVFTTHSLPERIVAKDPGYLSQLSATTDAVLAKLEQPLPKHYSAYQSAGHTPEPWLKPDLTDILADLRSSGDRTVLIVPIQFLADHLEILYDLDIAARQQCSEFGIEYNRIELPNTDPKFINALSALTHQSLS